MSGILQQGYSFGYVLAACANLGVGGGVESWKTVFWAAGEQRHEFRSIHQLTYHKAGLSIGVGLIRILFPESKQFLEAKKAGKRTMTAAEFSKETRSMLGRQWKLCVYCIILMTWVGLQLELF